MVPDYIDGIKKQFDYYKLLGEKTMAQLPDDALFWQYNETSNSIAVIVKHLSGNMLSRWTDFLTTDGEKAMRNRDAEFENEILTRGALLQMWDEGWKCFFDALYQIRDEDLNKIVYIRNAGHTVLEAINRQLAHYPYHIGQIVFIGKMVCDGQWQSLSIPRGDSKKYNTEKSAQPGGKGHFTDDFLQK
jgi:hypothetical protein